MIRIFTLTLLLLSSTVFANSRYKRIQKLMEEVKSSEVTTTLEPFSTDGCSMYPDKNYISTQEHNWIHCCIAHDISYWTGGTEEQRDQADEELASCVTDATSSQHGQIMYLGVQIGGAPGTGLPWAWGYGWNTFRKYHELDSKLISIALDLIVQVPEIIENLPADLVGDGLTDIQINYILDVLDYKQKELMALKELQLTSK